MKNILPFVLLIGLLVSCQSKKSLTSTAHLDSKKDLLTIANELAQKNIIVDGHIDLPYRLKISNFKFTKEFLGIPISSDSGEFDYVRAKKGGLNAPFMSIYIEADLQKETGASKQRADSLIQLVEGIANSHPDHFSIAFTPADVEEAFKAGRVALPMGMENGSGLEDDINNVAYFRKKGISYITLTHSKVNLICDSSYDTIRTWNGLSPYGQLVVKQMNKTGIMVDISHVSDSTFYQVMKLTKTPVIASHSSCRKFVPGFERNMSDDMIKALGKNGGVMMINFGSTFIDKKAVDTRNALKKELEDKLKSMNLDIHKPEADPVIRAFGIEHPEMFADIEMVADHIDHVVALAGIDHVGFGSDFDGVGDSLPTGLKDVAAYPNLIHALLKRGYSEEDISKICYKNIFRVWNSVLEYAKMH